MKNLLKYTFASLLLLVMALPSFAQITTQDETVPQPNVSDKKGKANRPPGEEKFWTWNKFYIGGIPGFGISDYYITVSVAADAGYFFHPHIAAGLTVDYTYVRDKYFGVSYNVIRFGPYVRGYIWKGIFAQAQYELTTIKNYREAIDTTGIGGPTSLLIPRLNNSSILLGGGYHDNFESGFGFYFSVLFNVLNTASSLTTNPEFQVGLTYRFNGGGYKKHKKKEPPKPVDEILPY